MVPNDSTHHWKRLWDWERISEKKTTKDRRAYEWCLGNIVKTTEIVYQLWLDR